jgi:hypothetical protein
MPLKRSRVTATLRCCNEIWQASLLEAITAEAETIAGYAGSRIVCLQELTLPRYFAITPRRAAGRRRSARGARIRADACVRRAARARDPGGCARLGV